MIARIDPYDYQRQYQTALANYKTTESIYERNQRLYAANAVAKQNLEIAQTDYIQATSALNMARRTLDYTVLTAPFDGFIEQRFVDQYPTTRHPEKDLCRIRFPKRKTFHDRGQRVYLFLERFGDTGDSTYYGQTVRPVSAKCISRIFV